VPGPSRNQGDWREIGLALNQYSGAEPSRCVGIMSIRNESAFEAWPPRIEEFLKQPPVRPAVESPEQVPDRQTGKAGACDAREGYGILSSFNPCKKCQRCPLVIVHGHQLIESGKAKDLTHSRLRTQEDRFGPMAIQRLSNG
jgi:hypothetical protein